MRTHTQTHVWTHKIHTGMYMLTGTHTHTHIHTHTHTHTHTNYNHLHKHKHTQTQAKLPTYEYPEAVTTQHKQAPEKQEFSFGLLEQRQRYATLAPCST